MEHKPHNALTEQELIIRAKLLRLENEDQKEDSQRWMIWFLLGGMLLYPFLVIICSYFNLENAAKLLEDMSNILFYEYLRLNQRVLWCKCLFKVKDSAFNGYKTTI